MSNVFFQGCGWRPGRDRSVGQRARWWARVLCALLLFHIASPLLSASEADAEEDAADAGKRLEQVRTARAERRQDLAQRNQQLVERQAQLEREDPIAAGLRAKMVEHQKEVEALRRSLKARLEAIEEIQALEAERRLVIEELQQLARDEQALLDASESAAEEAVDAGQ